MSNFHEVVITMETKHLGDLWRTVTRLCWLDDQLCLSSRYVLPAQLIGCPIPPQVIPQAQYHHNSYPRPHTTTHTPGPIPQLIPQAPYHHNSYPRPHTTPTHTPGPIPQLIPKAHTTTHTPYPNSYPIPHTTTHTPGPIPPQLIPQGPYHTSYPGPIPHLIPQAPYHHNSYPKAHTTPHTQGPYHTSYPRPHTTTTHTPRPIPQLIPQGPIPPQFNNLGTTFPYNSSQQRFI